MNKKILLFFALTLSFTSLVNAQSLKINTINNQSVADFINSRTLASTVIEAGEILTLNIKYNSIGDGFNTPKISARFLTKNYKNIKKTIVTKTIESSSETKTITIRVKVPHSDDPTIHNLRNIKLQVFVKGQYASKELMEYVDRLNVL